MPQTSVIPVWKADYPILQPRQKPPSISKAQSRTATAAGWTTGSVSVTFAATANDILGSSYPMTLSGFTPAGYNGVVKGLIASATTITFPLPVDPGGPATVLGKVAYTAQVPNTIGVALAANAVPNKPRG